MVEFYQVVFFLCILSFLFSCLSFCMPLLLTCSTFSRMVLNPFLFYWITPSPTLILCSILDRFSSCFFPFLFIWVGSVSFWISVFHPFAAEYSQVTCLRGKFSSSLFLEKKKHLSYFTVWQGLKLQVQRDFPSEFGEASQLCSGISVANGRYHMVVDSVGFCVSWKQRISHPCVSHWFTGHLQALSVRSLYPLPVKDSLEIDLTSSSVFYFSLSEAECRQMSDFLDWYPLYHFPARVFLPLFF